MTEDPNSAYQVQSVSLSPDQNRPRDYILLLRLPNQDHPPLSKVEFQLSFTFASGEEAFQERFPASNASVTNNDPDLFSLRISGSEIPQPRAGSLETKVALHAWNGTKFLGTWQLGTIHD